MSRLSLEHLVLHKETVLLHARNAVNPMYAKPLADLDIALDAYNDALLKLFTIVKLADSDDLYVAIIDAKDWQIMSPSQKQLHRIKKGIWAFGSRQADGLE